MTPKRKKQLLEENLISPPGDTIFECCIELNLEFKEVADKLELTEQDFDDLLMGEKPIDDAIAYKLQALIGVDAEFWINREANYQEQLKKL